MFKKQVIEALAKHISMPKAQIQELIETPPSEELGDYAFPCFILSKKQKSSPQEIAKFLSLKIKPKKT